MLPHEAAEALERKLGPHDDVAALEQDEREEFPADQIAALQRAGYCDYLVPVESGGKLASLDEALFLQRCVARRDLTVAIALGQSFLGSVAVWLSGSPAQKARIAALIRRGGLAALALTEEEHGSDILASEVHASAAHELTGRKWLINNGSRAEAFTVFARSDPAGGLSGFTCYLMTLPNAGYRALPKLRTHGIRGADISGFTLHDAPAEPIGALGSGAGLVLKGLQITRAGCAAFSLGAADTALRLALDFAVDRSLYGARVIDLPHARAQLATAFVDLLLGEAAALGALRAVQAAPAQLPLWSAAVKSFVPWVCERAIRQAALVLGARHQLRSGPFQKLLRDVSVVSLFDGSTAVALDTVGVQLLRLSNDPAPDRDQTLRGVFDLRAPLPPLDGARFELLNDGRDDLTQGTAPPLLQRPLARLREGLAALPRDKRKRSPELFALAERYCALHAAASCVQLLRHNQIDDFFNQGLWADACVARALGEPFDPEPLALRLLDLHRRSRLFSLLSPEIVQVRPGGGIDHRAGDH
jgi:alkylation response protein AidB-like acyl-CoA dehydrogenase